VEKERKGKREGEGHRIREGLRLRLFREEEERGKEERRVGGVEKRRLFARAPRTCRQYRIRRRRKGKEERGKEGAGRTDARQCIWSIFLTHRILEAKEGKDEVEGEQSPRLAKLYAGRKKKGGGKEGDWISLLVLCIPLYSEFLSDFREEKKGEIGRKGKARGGKGWAGGGPDSRCL